MAKLKLQSTFNDLKGKEIGSFKTGFVFVDDGNGGHKIKESDSGSPFSTEIYDPTDKITLGDVICMSLIAPEKDITQDEMTSRFGLMRKVQAGKKELEITDEAEKKRIKSAVFNCYKNQPMIFGQVNELLK